MYNLKILPSNQFILISRYFIDIDELVLQWF